MAATVRLIPLLPAMVSGCVTAETPKPAIVAPVRAKHGIGCLNRSAFHPYKSGLSACLAAVLALSACDGLPESFRHPVLPHPLTLPPADGRAAPVITGDGYRYLVNYGASEQARGKVFLRVTRASAPELTYSDGLTAKKVAEAYCAGFNRVLNPVAFGQFSLPASWIFEGGCQ